MVESWLLLLVGSERFTAWVILLTVGLLYRRLSQRMRGTAFYIPTLGVQIEALSWGTHQFNWWVYHMALMSPSISSERMYTMHLLVAAICYVGSAIGGCMMIQPFLYRKFGKKWTKVAALAVSGIWAMGLLTSLVWSTI